jgi:hypothetical protein
MAEEIFDLGKEVLHKMRLILMNSTYSDEQKLEFINLLSDIYDDKEPLSVRLPSFHKQLDVDGILAKGGLERYHYIIEASTNGKDWKHQAGFKFGDPSRFGTPFSPEVALQEARSFKFHRSRDYQFVRVRIEL